MECNFLTNNLKVRMVREARQGREEAHRIRSEAFLIKKGAGTCLIYSRVSVSPSSKRVQARA
jgi:hypothetical protein